jgi:predicted nuclease of predicted toxin-antitoxin system
VRFLVDAQLPARLARQLATAGHDVIHTSELPNGNRTTDDELVAVADAEDRIVVTKDRDFRNDHLLRHAPRRLLVVTTGNITNKALTALFARHLDAVVAALEEVRFVELGPESLVVHDVR